MSEFYDQAQDETTPAASQQPAEKPKPQSAMSKGSTPWKALAVVIAVGALGAKVTGTTLTPQHPVQAAPAPIAVVQTY